MNLDLNILHCPLRRQPHDACVALRASVRPLLDTKGGWVKPGRVYHAAVFLFSKEVADRLLNPQISDMPSRQERRKAERDAAKRAPRASAAGAAGAAAALADSDVNAGGDWTTQTEDPMVLHRALGAEILGQRAGDGDREAGAYTRPLLSST